MEDCYFQYSCRLTLQKVSLLHGMFFTSFKLYKIVPNHTKRLKHLAEKIANKSGDRYEKVQSVIKCKLSFLIL